VLSELRKWSVAPVIVLTAHDSEGEKVRLLNAGADDYVTKPFSPREVLLRVQAILRRGRPEGSAGPASPRASFGDGELVIDEDRHRVVVRGEPVELTPTEWGILTALTGAPGRVYSRFELINRVRGYEFEGYERTVDSHVKNLRRKVERDPHDPRIVEAVLGVGYRLGLHRDR
jgi:DNA-binding response OmpR family regulator